MCPLLLPRKGVAPPLFPNPGSATDGVIIVFRSKVLSLLALIIPDLISKLSDLIFRPNSDFLIALCNSWCYFQAFALFGRSDLISWSYFPPPESYSKRCVPSARPWLKNGRVFVTIVLLNLFGPRGPFFDVICSRWTHFVLIFGVENWNGAHMVRQGKRKGLSTK